MRRSLLLASLFLVFAIHSGCGSSPAETQELPPIFSDSFGGADSTTLGEGWAEVSAYPDFQIVGGQLKPVGGFGVAYASAAVTDDPVTSSVSIEIRGGTATALQIHLLARSQSKDSLNNAYSCVLISNRVQIYKIEGGSNTSLVAGTATIPNTDGTRMSLSFNLNGNLLTCSVSGAVSDSVTITDSTFAAGGYFGVGAGNSGDTIYLDDFTITKN